MMSCRVRTLNFELIKAIKIVRQRTNNKDQKEVISILLDKVKEYFSKTDDLHEISCKLDKKANQIKAENLLYGEYGSFILSLVLKKTASELEFISKEFTLKEGKIANKIEMKKLINDYYDSAISSVNLKFSYKNSITDEGILMENIAFHPMFLEILKNDKDKVLLDFKPDNNNYIYGIVYNGLNTNKLSLIESKYMKECGMFYGGIELYDEKNDFFIFNSYYLFRITKSSYYEAKKLLENHKSDDFIKKYESFNKEVVLNESELLKLAEIYMKVIEKKETVVAHVRVYILSGVYVDRIN